MVIPGVEEQYYGKSQTALMFRLTTLVNLWCTGDESDSFNCSAAKILSKTRNLEIRFKI